MKFVQRDLGESAENSSGGGRRGLFREVVVLSVLTCLAVTLLYWLSGVVADFAVRRISVEREQILFESVSRQYLEPVVPEAMNAQWEDAQIILGKLVQYEGVPRLDYQLAYSPEPLPNAYAVPGGVIVLTQGVLENIEEEVSLAFIIAHELGHFAGRDHLQGVGRQIGFRAGIALLTGGSSDGLLNSATQLMTLNYSRTQEAAADAFAIRCLDDVYGHHEGAARLFQLLDESDGVPDWAYMFLSHPANAERIRTIEE